MDHNMDMVMILNYDYATHKAAETSKCTSITGHFDGHTDTLKRYMQHHPMQHGQGYTGSHCTPPSGN
jgi:hypothetical protein